MTNPAAAALIEAAERRYRSSVARGVDEYLCAHAQAQEVIMIQNDHPITERREIFKNRLTFEEDAGL